MYIYGASLNVKRDTAILLIYTEHWLNFQKLHAINTDYYTVANAFCTTSSEHGGSSIYVEKDTVTKQLNYLQELGEGRNSELSLIELPDMELQWFVYTELLMEKMIYF